MTSRAPHRPTTLAVVVSPGVSPYLPRTLEAIAAQSHAPDTVLVVDVSNADNYGSGEPLTDAIDAAKLEAHCQVRLVSVPEASNFGDAIRRGLVAYHDLVERAAERRERQRDSGIDPDSGSWSLLTGELSPVTSGEIRAVPRAGVDPASREHPDWLWLLHDDSAPGPQALDHQLHAAESGRSIAIVGPKQRDWRETDALVSVGISATRSARRVPEIDAGEIDQGQWDHREDVLAVGTAGMLIGETVWQELNGTDPSLGPFGDGLELSRRARVAGYRVVVATGAVVYHARASLFALRRVDGKESGRPRSALSFRERRKAQIHNALLAHPAGLGWLIALGYLLLGPLRALVRIATKEGRLAVAEISAGVAALSMGKAVRHSRSNLKRTARIPLKSFPRTLEARGKDIRQARSDRRRHTKVASRRIEAPSELEIRERQERTRRRRRGLTVTVAALVAGALAVFLPSVLGGVAYGGALGDLGSSAASLWETARSSWVPRYGGTVGPADPLLSVLAVLSFVAAPLGLSPSAVAAVLVVAAVPLAGLTAWAAAGAATRSVLLRCVVAVFWALSAPLLLAAGQGRLGAILAHIALPIVALGLARVVGSIRRDVSESGMVGAKRLDTADAAQRASESLLAQTGRAEAVTTASSPSDEEPDDAEPAGDHTDEESSSDESSSDEPSSPADEETKDEKNKPAPRRATRRDTASRDVAQRQPAAGDGSTRSERVSAAAWAAIALTIAAAGAPVLFLVAVVVVVLLSILRPTRTPLLLGSLIPAAALLMPLLIAAVRDLGAGSWRIFLADPGIPFATEPVPSWVTALGWPVALPGEGTWPTILAVAGVGVLALMALLALLRIRGATAVRLGWVIVALGISVAALATRTDVAVSNNELVRAWPGVGTSLIVLGLLLAVAAGGDGLVAAVRRTDLGWRQPAVMVMAVTLLAAPVAQGTAWAVLSRSDGAQDWQVIQTRDAEPVPALAAELQRSSERSRVLALDAGDNEVGAQLWRGRGEMFATHAVVPAAAPLEGWPDTEVGDPDDSALALAAVTAELMAGASSDITQQLGDLAISVVIIRPETLGDSGESSRTDLAARLDSIPGLERITENETGIVWRVSRDDNIEGAADSTARARITDTDGAYLDDVPAENFRINTTIDDGPDGRSVVLAEAAHENWHATVDGQPLEATEMDWRQAFELPATGGHLEIWHTVDYAWLISGAQALTVGLAIVLALPLRPRREVM